MKNAGKIILLMTLLFAAPIRAQENAPQHVARRGDGAGYSTRDATVLSMMGWGIGLAVGIALLCGYLEQETGHAH